MIESNLSLAYLSPETVLPLTSILATVAGVSLLLTRSSFRFLIRCVRVVLRRPKAVEGAKQPHFRSAAVGISEKAGR